MNGPATPHKKAFTTEARRHGGGLLPGERGHDAQLRGKGTGTRKGSFCVPPDTHVPNCTAIELRVPGSARSGPAVLRPSVSPWLIPLVALLLCGPEAQAGDLRSVDLALAKARAAMEMSLRRDGAAETGPAALRVLACLRAGSSPYEMMGPAVRVLSGAERAATADDYAGVYAAGLVLEVLLEFKSCGVSLHKEALAEKLARRLLRLQRPDGSWGDLSRTAFAARGLAAAERLGVRLVPSPWARLRGSLRASRNADGGWGYKPGRSSTATMTADALLVLALSGAKGGEAEVAGGIGWLQGWLGAKVRPGKVREKEPHRFYLLMVLGCLIRERPGWLESLPIAGLVGAALAEQLPGGGLSSCLPAGRLRAAEGFATEQAALFLSEARGMIAGGPARGDAGRNE